MRSDNGAFSSSASSVSELDVLAFTVSGMTLYVTNLSMNLRFSNDEKHDHHFTHYVQNQIAEYLRSISCDVDVMHELCDGCASQYKSRHCLGDLSNSFREFGYRKIVRNFFETAHAKGPQDAAGGFLKNQAD
jgi:hypothetical protein